MGDSTRALADALRTHRAALSTALLESVRNWDKYSRELAGGVEEEQEFVRRELVAFVDYLSLFFERSDANYRHLYIGEKLKQCHDPRDSAGQSRERRLAITSSDRAVFLRMLTPVLNAGQLESFLAELDSIHQVVNAEGKRRARCLLIGDCLHLDIVAFLTAPLLEHGVTLEPTFLTSKNPMDLQAQILGLQDSAFDLIFYSPFSYAFQLDYTQLQYVRAALTNAKDLAAITDAAIADTESALRLLGNTFEAPIFVHNSANIQRHNKSVRERLKSWSTQPVRRRARKIINAWLPGHLDRLNAESFRHFFLLDEASLLKAYSEDRLGATFYDSDMQHPAEFGKALVPLYQTAVLAGSLLLKKKLIVCDLDNTLWDGVIGEGAVRHYEDRQRTLKALRNKGVLLAINSKNDPKNVNWAGAVLGTDDFVSSQINWGSKVVNLQTIARELNLKTKDFVFIDDRADERAMVDEFLPEVLTLDAESAEVWRQLALVAEMLQEQSETDRTLAYKQREKREKFLTDLNGENGQQDAALQQQELFRKLGLAVSIRPAEEKELKRVAELINRTNQFNMQGSRTTLKQMAAWHQDPDHAVIVVEASDRFGSMGVISVIVLALGEREVEVPIFVLSCRVFGYGVETAILNFVKRVAGHSATTPGKPVVGHLTHTPHNEPCRKVYPDNGFSQNGDRWTFAGGASLPDPEWLQVTSLGVGSPLQK